MTVSFSAVDLKTPADGPQHTLWDLLSSLPWTSTWIKYVLQLPANAVT